MRIDENDNRHVFAGDGKIFRRKSDNRLFGKEIFLGYTYYINDEKLDEPLLEFPGHYEEIDMPEEYREGSWQNYEVQ